MRKLRSVRNLLVLGGTAVVITIVVLMALWPKTRAAASSPPSTSEGEKLGESFGVLSGKSTHPERAGIESSPSDYSLTDEGLPDSDTFGTGRVTKALSAVETSLYGAIDPNQLVEHVASLLDLNVSERAIPEPQPQGALLFPIEGTSEGMVAQLRVTPTQNPRFKNVLAIDVTFDIPREPYLLEGMIRRAPMLQVQCWTDTSGELTDIKVMATVGVSGESLKPGLNPHTGTIIEGLTYHMSMEPGSTPTIKAFGLKDGGPVAGWDTVASVENGDLSPDLARSFSQRLLQIYNDIKSR